MKPKLIFFLTSPSLLLLASCAHVSVDPIEVKPIHITMDINVKVDRELDNFFAFEKKYEPATQPTSQPAAPQPATATAQDSQ